MKDTIEIQVDSLAFGGDAVARHEGKAVFVPGGAPGDRLRIQLTEQNRRYARGVIVEVLEAGPARVAAPCPTYGECGGCQWQHVAYADQFQAKVEIVTRALQRYAPREITQWPAPAASGYRRRARLHWSSRDTLALGFHARQSERVVATSGCLQLEPALDACLPRLRELLEHAGRSIGEAELLCNDQGDIHLGLRLNSGDAGPLLAVMAEHANPWWSGAVVRHGSQTTRLGAESIRLDSRQLMASATVFTQANAAQDAVLRACVSAHVVASTASRITEFHAGIGNFTVDLARSGIAVDAIEASPQAVALLLQNCQGLPVTGTVADAEQVEWQDRMACALLDPPREGAPALIPRLAAKKVPKIVYVSCDPMTLARDLAVLAGARYRLQHVDIIDMMPHTYHLETVCFLSRH